MRLFEPVVYDESLTGPRCLGRWDSFTYRLEESRVYRVSRETMFALGSVVMLAGGLKSIQWANESTYEETALILGSTGLGLTGFAAAGIYSCAKALRSEFIAVGKDE